MNDSSTLYDILILGSGPAGLTAALYAARGYLKTLVIGGNPSGGQLTTTTEVANYPGFPEGITGPELISNFKKQAEKYGAVFVDENVVKIFGSFDENFKVETDEKNTYQGKSVVLATGASPKWLGLPGEEKLKGRGVSVCATCDGYFYKEKVVAVVGGGDAAMEEADFLTRFATKVYVLVRKEKEKMRASKFMQARALENPKVEFLFNTEVKEILGENKVEGLKIVNNVSGEEKVLTDVGGLFVAIGHEPNTNFLRGFVELDEKGYVKRFDGSATSKAGVFAAGDASDFKYRQCITAASFGSMAAIDTIKFLSEHGVKTVGGLVGH